MLEPKGPSEYQAVRDTARYITRFGVASLVSVFRGTAFRGTSRRHLPGHISSSSRQIYLSTYTSTFVGYKWWSNSGMVGLFQGPALLDHGEFPLAEVVSSLEGDGFFLLLSTEHVSHLRRMYLVAGRGLLTGFSTLCLGRSSTCGHHGFASVNITLC